MATSGDINPGNDHACDKTGFACVPLTNGNATCLNQLPFPGVNFSVYSYSVQATLGGPFSVGFDYVTSPDGVVVAPTISGALNPQTLSGIFYDTPGNPTFCIDFHFSAEGRFFCQTEVCLAKPPC